MAAASAKDIQDLSKSIHQLIKAVGSSPTGKTKATTTVDKAPQYSESDYLNIKNLKIICITIS